MFLADEFKEKFTRKVAALNTPADCRHYSLELLVCINFIEHIDKNASTGFFHSMPDDREMSGEEEADPSYENHEARYVYFTDRSIAIIKLTTTKTTVSVDILTLPPSKKPSCADTFVAEFRSIARKGEDHSEEFYAMIKKHGAAMTEAPHLQADSDENLIAMRMPQRHGVYSMLTFPDWSLAVVEFDDYEGYAHPYVR